MTFWRQLEAKWNRIQVGRQGSYSIERLMSLEHYCNTTSWTRVILVCVLTPVPALSVALLLECLPLRPPSEGWAASWMFWLRLALTHGVVGTNVFSQMTMFVPGLKFTFCKQFIVTTGGAIGLVGTCILAADTIGFPVPLTMQFGTIPTGISTTIMLRLAIGPGIFMSGSPIMVHLKRFYRAVLAFMTLIGVYPLFKVLYNCIPVGYRGGVVLVLPIWRFAAKHFIVHATRDLEDIVPESVAFLVDFFSSLFVSVCMSSSGPFYLSFLFITTDLVQILLEIRELSDNAKVVLQLIRQEQTSPTHERSCPPETTKLLTIILDGIKEPGAFQAKSLKSVRLWACLPHPLTAKQIEQLRNLESSGAYYQRKELSSDRMKRSPMPQAQNGLKKHSSIAPTPNLEHETSSPTIQHIIEAMNAHTDGPSTVKEKSNKLVLQGLQLLFHCEYLELVEYVECITPIVYVVYKSVLEQLPNVVYYPGGAGSWGIATVVNILVLAMLEVTSLVFLHHFLQRKFAFSAMYQLAFVLETHVYLVQMMLFTGVLLLIPFELKHFGADFSFRFEWFRDK
ncbi:hypothetical protein PC128_g19500 [Phytophthora cactorum]|nr:hypothetical protein PC128_g19500 [Phytophthora cactorum]